MSPIENNPALIPPGAAGGVAPGAAPAASSGSAPAAGRSFAATLKEASGGAQPLQFSKHAIDRIQRRGIALDASTLQRLNEGVTRAAGKGSRDSLVFVDGTAFVVSVNNHTVITAVGSEHMKQNVFTNIDSAVIA
jgi:flagellar operon protein